MDEQTLRYYDAHAAEVADRYDGVSGGIDKLLRLAFDQGMRVLDVGTGSGRDMCYLLEMGVDAYGVEPSEELRASAIRSHPLLAARLEGGGLPDLCQPFGGRFDGVLCSAVLMHLPRETVFDAALALRNVLVDNGRLLVSIPLNFRVADQDHRDSHGRLFTPLNPDYLAVLFERLGFQVLGRWDSDDAMGREGRRWCTLLFQLRHSEAMRPVDAIAGILSRDKKFATYKLALFRALCEIATTQFEQGRWIDGGLVAVPISTVCEKWLYYYWPLFESAQFIPQIRGEADDCLRPVAFRRAVSDLIACYQRAGGLHRFVLDWRNDTLSQQARALLGTALRRIRNTIVQGPVTFAGGSLEMGRVFRYDAHRKEVEMPAGIWRELSFLGHWIQDAITLRWAELTSEIARGRIRPSEVIDLLLITPLPERDVVDARQTYANLAGVECTWSGERIGPRFDVDHIIPFSLWHNNELWNLVPVLPSINSKKGERLPTRTLLMRRRNYLTFCWEELFRAHPRRFEREACQLLGMDPFPRNWQQPIYRCVLEAIEVTAVQRGQQRWEP